jgi:hypothetical protein
VNAGNTSIEDVHVESYWDGVRIGDVSQSQVSFISNVLVSNLFTSPSGYCTQQGYPEYVTNAVHICGSIPNNNINVGMCTNTGVPPVTDLTALGVTNYLNNGSNPMTSIQDDETGSTIEGCLGTGCSGVIATALYALGEQSGSGFTRMVTSSANNTSYGSGSTAIAAWGVGATGVSGTTCYIPGALYSSTSAGVGGNSLYVCTFSGSNLLWTALTTP